MREEFPVTACFFLALVLKYRIEAYLFNRQSEHLKIGRGQIPFPFENKIELSSHQKACDYALANLNARRTFNIISLVILLTWTMAGGLEKLDYFLRNFQFSPLVMGLLFIGSFSLISSLLQLPQDIYHTFVIEEKYGFNRSTPSLFIKDQLKSLLLSIIIGLPIISGLLLFMEKSGEFWWAWAFIFTTIIQLLIFWLYPVFIAPLFNKFSPLDEGELKEKLKALLARTNFKAKNLFVMDASKRSSHGNAYFTGFGKNKQVVLFDNLLLNLNHEEIEAVLAHELGHSTKKHTQKNLLLFIAGSFIFFLLMGFLSRWDLFYKGHGVLTISSHMTLILFSLIFSTYSFPLTPLFSKFSRKMEFEADRFVVETLGKGDHLASALLKMYKDNSSPLSSDPSYSAFYYSHPPIKERLEALENKSTSL